MTVGKSMAAAWLRETANGGLGLGMHRGGPRRGAYKRDLSDATSVSSAVEQAIDDCGPVGLLGRQRGSDAWRHHAQDERGLRLRVVPLEDGDTSTLLLTALRLSTRPRGRRQ